MRSAESGLRSDGGERPALVFSGLRPWPPGFWSGLASTQKPQNRRVFCRGTLRLSGGGVRLVENGAVSGQAEAVETALGLMLAR
jgi:hypothetical protein